MTILSRDSVFVYLAQQTNSIHEVEIAIELDSSVSLVRQRLRDLGDAVETDGDGNWCIPSSGTKVKTEEEQRLETRTNDGRYVREEIEQVSDRSTLLELLGQLHNLRQELFLHAHNTSDDLKKNQLLATVVDKDKQITSVKQKLGLSETNNYQIELYICFIRCDGGTQPRAAMDENTIDEYAEAMGEETKFPPITVFFDGEFWLADGFHRLKAAEKIGLFKITVEVKQGSLRDAVLYSCGANATHGLRRSNVDKRRAVLRLLEDKEWSQWSDRSIARCCGVSHDLVNRMRKSHCHNMTVTKLNDKNLTDKVDEAIDERTYTTKYGTTGKMKTGKISKSNSKRFKKTKDTDRLTKTTKSDLRADVEAKKMKKEGLNYKPGLGCEWNVKVEQSTWKRLQECQAKLGTATLDGAINRLIDLASDLIND